MSDRYEIGVSQEPLEIIRANECENQIGSLSTSRFRRLWNEIVDLREQLAAGKPNISGIKIIERPDFAPDQMEMRPNPGIPILRMKEGLG